MKTLLVLAISFATTLLYGQVKVADAPRRIQKTIAKNWFIGLNLDSVKKAIQLFLKKIKTIAAINLNETIQ